MHVSVTTRQRFSSLWAPNALLFVVLLPLSPTSLSLAPRRELMFTGLVETIGTIAAVAAEPPGKRLSIDAPGVCEGVSIGDSIAISGCCLTVVAIDGTRLDFEAGEETLLRTNLDALAVGGGVNLERSLVVGDRLGGHYVTGHVDAVGTLIERRDDPPWAHLRFQLPERFASQVAAKGSIAVDGISLTVVEADTDSFTVALIPHTLDATTLGQRSVGDRVNLETDVLAKYVQRSLEMSPVKLNPNTES
jgi:riboflavin synthase